MHALPHLDGAGADAGPSPQAMGPLRVTALARAFTLGGALLATLSLAALAACGAFALLLHLAPPTGGTSVAAHGDVLLGLLAGVARTAERAWRLGAFALLFLLGWLAAVSTAGLAAGWLCWRIGRGLRSSAAWARVGAGVVLTLLLAAAGAAGLSFDDTRRLLAVAAAAAAAIGLRSLWAERLRRSAAGVHGPRP